MNDEGGDGGTGSQALLDRSERFLTETNAVAS